MRILIFLFLLLNTAFLSASDGRDAVLIDDSLKGVYRMYDFDTECYSQPAPKGYKVFYLSHYGRHGSRYLHNEREYDTLNVVLHREKLTPFGEMVREQFDLYYPLLKGRATDLSEVGKMQHRMLASRMYKDYPELFRRGSVVYAVSSDIPRCLMSMHYFLGGLKECNKSLDVRADFNSSLVPLFRASQVKKFPLKEFLEDNLDPVPLFEKLFECPQESFKGTDPYMFAQTLFYYACHLEGVGIDDDFFDSVLSNQDLKSLHMVESEKFSYNRGSLCKENLMVAAPSLHEIILSADNDMQSGFPTVRLRFGHDNMIMNLMSLMSVRPFDKERFDCSDVPMASNIRFVFAKNKSGHVIIKIQYNESDVTDWMSWDNFRAECMRRISGGPRFMAHRGLQSYGPENSIASFNAAAREGVWAIETDFRITADGRVVCIHDRTLDRTTDGAGPVKDMTLDEIRALRLKPVNSKGVVPIYDYSQLSESDKIVPSMEEYFEICKNNGCVAFIELKEDCGVIESMMRDRKSVV